MKTQRFFWAGLGIIAATGGASHADVTWEHSGQVRLTKAKDPIMKLKVFTNITPTHQRVLVKQIINPTGMGSVMNGMGGFGNAMGEVGGAGSPMLTAFASPSKLSRLAFAQLADDSMANPFNMSTTMVQSFEGEGQFLTYNSMKKEYMGGTIKELLAKSRIDPWKKLAPKLSQNEPPALTHEQRARLGAELRAVTEPFTKMMFKTYFREYDKPRTLNGLEGHGYRMTMLINTANPMAGENRWMRLAMEWWVAGPQAGDEVMVQMRQAALKLVGRDRKATTSMWINESPRVLWEMMPEEFHRALSTVMPSPEADPDSAEFKRTMTPLAMYMTVSPPDEYKAKWGEVRAELNLIRRGTETLPASIFEAPAGYKLIPFPDIMKQMEDIENAAKAGAAGKMPMPTP